MTPTDRAIERLRNPKPGGKIWEAREYGVDLTLLMETLRRTPGERMRFAEEFAELAQEFRKASRKSKPDEPQLLEGLAAGRVDFVIVGDLAAISHGAEQATCVVDICYSRAPENLERLVRTVADWHPKLRGAPEGLPFLWNAETLRRGLNFTLTTDLGAFDLLGEVAGVGTYEQVRANAVIRGVFSIEYAVISLPDLISSKKAADRAKDKEALPELEALWEAQQDD